MDNILESFVPERSPISKVTTSDWRSYKSMNFKRISAEDVANVIANNREQGARDMHAQALAGISAGTISQVPLDPHKPWALRMRFRREKDTDPEAGWSVHPKLRFHSIATASYVAKDLMKLDPKLEVQIDRAG